MTKSLIGKLENELVHLQRIGAIDCIKINVEQIVRRLMIHMGGVGSDAGQGLQNSDAGLSTSTPLIQSEISVNKPFPCDLDKVKELHNRNQGIFHPDTTEALYRAIRLLEFYKSNPPEPVSLAVCLNAADESGQNVLPETMKAVLDAAGVKYHE